MAGRRTQCFGSHHPIAALPAPFGEYWVPGRGISGNEAHTGVSRSSGTAYLPTGLASRPAVRYPRRPGIPSEAGESRSPIQPVVKPRGAGATTPNPRCLPVRSRACRDPTDVQRPQSSISRTPYHAWGWRVGCAAPDGLVLFINIRGRRRRNCGAGEAWTIGASRTSRPSVSSRA